MFSQIPKRRINAICGSNSSSINSGNCLTGAIVARQTRCLLRRFGRRTITSNYNYPSFHKTCGIPFHFCLNVTGNDLETRRTNVAVVDSINGLQQQAEHHIPQPTWSLKNLKLTSTHIPITQQELERLAQLVLVDMSRNSNMRDDETIVSLKQDLGDMFHMIQHISESDCWKSKTKDVVDTRNIDDKDDPTISARIYDIVKGVRGIPLRNVTEEDPLQAQDAVQARAVWEVFLQSKMIRRDGGHQYFSIETTERSSR